MNATHTGPLVLADIALPKALLSEELEDFFSEALVFENPDYAYEMRQRGKSTEPPTFDLRRETDDAVLLPKGMCAALEDFNFHCASSSLDKPLSQPFVLTNLTLRDDQTVAVEALAAHETGIMRAPTGFGKTAAALGLIEKLQQKTLIVVANGKKSLLHQWKEAIAARSGLPLGEIGQLGDGVKDLRDITVALPPTLFNMLPDTDLSGFGLVITDECHATTVNHFLNLYPFLPAKRRYGFSATPDREGALKSLPQLVFGPIRYAMTQDEAVEKQIITKFRVVMRETGIGFVYQFGQDLTAYKMLQRKIYGNAPRNALIGQDLKDLLVKQKQSLVIVERLAHLKHLHKPLKLHPFVRVVTGETSSEERQAVLDAFKNGYAKMILTTDQIFREGLDLPNIDVIVLPLLRQSEVALTQTIGRGRRTHNDKEWCTVVDYVDRSPKTLQIWEGKKKHVYMDQPVIVVKPTDRLLSLFS